MVTLNRVIRKSVYLLSCMLAVAVTPTYIFLLCSASQCNQRNHDYEQAFVANQPSESGKCGSSSTDEAGDASKATKAKVDQADDTWQQARDQEVTGLLSEKPSDQEREIIYLDDVSAIPSEETEAIDFAADSIIRDVSGSAKGEVAQADSTWQNHARNQRMIERLGQILGFDQECTTSLDNTPPTS